MNATQFLLILYARKWLILGVLLSTVVVVAAISLLLPKEYTATTVLIIDTKSKDPLLGQFLPSQLTPAYMTTQADIINSDPVASRVVEGLKLAEIPGTREQFMEDTKGEGEINRWLGELLQRKLKVEHTRVSSLLSIKFTGSDPKFSAIIANAFAKAYIETSLDLRTQPSKQNAFWFERQITQLRADLDQAQQKLTAYQRENSLVDSEERVDVENRKLSSLADQMIAAQSASLDASSRINDGSSMPEVINNPVIQNLKGQLAQGESKLSELSKRVGTNHPGYIQLLAEVGSYKARLASEIVVATRSVSATAGAARRRMGDMGSAFDLQKTKMLALKQQRETGMILARDVGNAQSIYDLALQRYGQSRMEAQSTQNEISVLSPALAPTKPSKPRLIFNVLLAVLFGTLLGVGVCVLVELLDRRVRAGSDVITALGIPVLAELPRKSGVYRLVRRIIGRKRFSMARA